MKKTQLLSLLCLALLTACYEPKEGCTDAAATNLDLDADEACMDCCTYPELRLSLLHSVVLPGGSTKFTPNAVYYDGANQPFRFKSIRFYLSNIRLIRADGSEVGVSDEIELDLFDPSGMPRKGTVEDNFLLTNAAFDQTYVIGQFRQTGNTFTKVRFAIGIEGLGNEAIPDSLPTDYPLGRIEEGLHFNQDSGYVFNYIELLRDTAATDTIPVVMRIGTAPYLRVIELDLPASYTPVEGFNTLLTLQVNYALWFQDLNARQDTPAQMIEKIVQNLANSFSVLAVEKK